MTISELLVATAIMLGLLGTLFGLTNPALKTFALDYIAAHKPR